MNKSQDIELAPMYRLPFFIILLGMIFLIPSPLPIWIGVVVIIFGLFLLIQACTLRIKITSKAFIVLQLGKEIRCFPFEDWIAWKVYLPTLPGILYFREQASPHLLPILFDIQMLKSQLELRVGPLEIKNKSK